jgi:wyosine [tRNA(Phe)-imidazoG37] synthetase (radical SAM superfamily)
MISLVRILQSDPVYFPLVEIHRKQPVISDFYSKDRINPLAEERVLEINKRTSEHFVYLPEDDFETTFDYLRKLGTRNFLFPIHLVETNDSQNIAIEKIRSIAKTFEKIHNTQPEVGFGFVLKFEKVLPTFSNTLLAAAKSGSKLNVLLPLAQDKALATQVSKAFDFLRYLGVKTFFPIAPWILSFGWWQTNIRSPYLGPRVFDIDISNRCNHSCHFCGLYSSEAVDEMKAKSNEKGWQDYLKLKSQIIDREQFHRTLDTLPITVRDMQFGGAGEPTLHPNFIEFVERVRERGINLEILSNLSINNDREIEKLHSLGGKRWDNLHFFVNLSGPDPETYVATRPKQTAKDFHLVVKNLKRLTELREKNGNEGVFFTLQMVLTNRNFRKCKEFVELAKEVGALRVFLKPMVITANSHYLQLPSKDEMKEYDYEIRQAKEMAKNMSLEIL